MTSTIHGSLSKRLPDAALLPPGPRSIPPSDGSPHSSSRSYRQHSASSKQNMEAATPVVRVAAGNRSSLQPEASKRGHMEGQTAPRNCPGLMFMPDAHSGGGIEGGGSAVSCSRLTGSVSPDTGEDTAFLRVSAWCRVCEAPHPGAALPSSVT